MTEQITKTIIASGITIVGNITGEGDVEINGHVIGDVTTANNITLADGSQVEGKAQCKKISVSGYMAGDVDAKEAVEVGKGGVLVGKIKTPRLHLSEDGAIQGEVEMPIADDRKRVKSQLKPMSVAGRSGSEASTSAGNGSH